MVFQMTIGNLAVVTGDPKEIRFWVQNEIGTYKGMSVRAEEWCSKAKVGDVYYDEFICIEVLETKGETSE